MATLYLYPVDAGEEDTFPNQYPNSGQHWDKVDDPATTPDDVATTIFTGDFFPGTGQCLYTLTTPSVSGVINWIKVWVRVGIVAGCWIRIKTGGTTYESEYQNPTSSAWVSYDQNYTLNPKTGVAWTWGDLAALQAGIRMTGARHVSYPPYEVYDFVYCTQVYVEVDYTPPSYIGFHTASAQRRYKASTFSTFTFPDPAGSGFTSDTASYAMLAGWGGAPIPSLLYQLLASDGIKLSDAAVAQSLISLLASDGLKLSDAATVYKFLSLLASDGVKLSDSSVAQLIAQAAVIDGAKFSDSATVGLLFNLLTSDGIKLSDSAVIIKVISEIVADGVKFSDSAAAGLIFQVLASDGIKLSDSAILELLAIILLIRKLQKRTLTAKLYQRDFILKLPDRSLVTKKEE